MKKINILIVAILMLASFSLIAQVAITTDGSSADGSAMLEVKSTNKGFLPPLMTEAQMNAISNPAEGLIVYCTDCNPKAPYYFDGLNFVNFASNGPSDMSATDVYNPTTGETWMDRNLGASQVATSYNDAASYGDLYQWGRAADGHQIRTSATTITLSNTDNPGHDDFIKSTVSPYDWRSGQNGNLWQGESGINNPCPSGYRLPIEAEWTAECGSWTSNNSAGAYASPLKLSVAGYRDGSDGAIKMPGSYGIYWTSTVNVLKSRSLLFRSDSAYMSSYDRAQGSSVRCIKD